jgi:hypothetical protein
MMTGPEREENELTITALITGRDLDRDREAVDRDHGLLLRIVALSDDGKYKALVSLILGDDTDRQALMHALDDAERIELLGL